MMLTSMPEYKVQTIAQNVASDIVLLHGHHARTLENGCVNICARGPASFVRGHRWWTLSEVNIAHHRNSAKNSDSRPNSI